MKRIAVERFKKQCLTILDKLDPSGIIITKHGKPIAILRPINSKSAELIGALKGKLKIKGDVLSTGLKWDAEL